MSDNPGNFANRPAEEVKQAAAKGGHIAHHPEDSAPAGRNPDGTFMKGSHAAKDAGHIGGLHAEGESGRRDDGTFVKGSAEAKEAGHKGGIH
ncbi:conidiation-specific protein [Phyllosticta citricarpa]|uniref:Conidiation-specific protein n=2 Tax=Phyllosticta TaxID=121621 RepID=A0ABR1MDW6_9PEZI